MEKVVVGCSVAIHESAILKREYEELVRSTTNKRLKQVAKVFDKHRNHITLKQIEILKDNKRLYEI